MEDVVVVRQAAARKDSIDALSFGTVLSSDDDDDLVSISHKGGPLMTSRNFEQFLTPLAPSSHF